LLKFLESYLNQDWIQIVTNCNLNHWKEALAAVLSYNSDQDLFNLCNILGNRLENESKLLNACICYICSSNLNKLTDCWLKVKKTNDDNELSTILQVIINLDFQMIILF
jgi:protein transport protein SEC31